MKLGAKTLTPQEEALKLARKRFGAAAFTEDRVGFRLFAVDHDLFLPLPAQLGLDLRPLEWTGTGPTWEAAQQDLERAHPELLRKTEAEPCR